MAVYRYKALGADRSQDDGTIVADTPRQARDLLRQRGLTVVDLKRHEVKRTRRPWARRGRLERESAAFLRELSTLLRAGIPLLGALQTLSRQHGRRYRAIVQELADAVSAGASLAEAMAAQPICFDELCISVVRVGETTGDLEEALSKLSAFKEKSLSLKSNVATALLYPAVVLSVGMALGVFLMTYVVPSILSILVESGKELPPLTRAVKGASDLLVGYWWGLALGLAGAALALRAVLATEGGRWFFDGALIRIPVIGTLIRKELTGRMAVVLSALLSNGLAFPQAVGITRQTLSNRVYRRALADYEQAVGAGRDVAASLEASGVFAPMVVQMLAVGVQTGQLEQMLDQLAETYDREVAVATGRLASVLEPFLIVVLAAFIAVIAFATILPILEVSNVL